MGVLRLPQPLGRGSTAVPPPFLVWSKRPLESSMRCREESIFSTHLTGFYPNVYRKPGLVQRSPARAGAAPRTPRPGFSLHPASGPRMHRHRFAGFGERWTQERSDPQSTRTGRAASRMVAYCGSYRGEGATRAM